MSEKEIRSASEARTDNPKEDVKSIISESDDTSNEALGQALDGFNSSGENPKTGTGNDFKEWYRNFSVHIRGEPLVIFAIEELISNIQNLQNLNRNQTIRKIFDIGIEVLSKDATFGMDKVYSKLRYATLFRRAGIKYAKQIQFDKYYQKLGPDEMMKIAEELDIDLS